MHLEQNQQIKQQLSVQQRQSVELLQMSAQEMESCLQELAQENPLIVLEDNAPKTEPAQKDELVAQLQWLEETDHQNRYYRSSVHDEVDEPLERVGCGGGLDETLFSFLSRQIDRRRLPVQVTEAVKYLIYCLDEDGYLRISVEELARTGIYSQEELERAYELLLSLEPAGVGAANLSQCLQLQLQRIHYSGPAVEIVEYHLEELAQQRYRAIAARLGITQGEVRQAQQVIRSLEPRPGIIFAHPHLTQYVRPDVFVVEEDGVFVVQEKQSDHPIFRMNPYYLKLLSESDDPAVREYLNDKLHQARQFLWAADYRETTLLRVARAVVRCQQGFFRSGPQALKVLHMAEIARELGVHESTISRAVREKYLQCHRGVYPLRYFFSREAVKEDGNGVAGKAAREQLRILVSEEDPACPKSDQQLSDEMKRLGCPISRRTVAKYRNEMNIPGAFARKRRYDSQRPTE